MTTTQTPTPDESEPVGGLVGSAVNDQLRRELSAAQANIAELKKQWDRSKFVNRALAARLESNPAMITELKSALLLYHEAWCGCEGDWKAAMRVASKNADKLLESLCVKQCQ